MKFEGAVRVLFSASIGLCLLCAGQLIAEPAPGPEGPVKIHGIVTARIEPQEKELGLWVHVSRDAKPISGLAVALMGTKAGESGPGEYVCTIHGFNPIPGTQVNVTFSQQPNFPSPDPAFPITAQATIGSLIQITNPKNEAHIHLPPMGMLNISWTGGKPPYKIIIQPFKDPDIFEGEIFHKEGILGTNVSVPMVLFKPGKKYAIFALNTMSEFKFNKPVDDTTPFELMQRVRINIYTD